MTNYIRRMIRFEKRMLANGLKVIIHPDKTTPVCAVNLLYKVGARNEDASRTGFAHLFEHLMFGGSKNVPVFDEPLQRAGGENNAFTSNDITNYYETLPLNNLELALWLESDRMTGLDINNKTRDVQRRVVSEEFKEHYLNQPYGDVWHLLRELAYKTHPYKWPTIGLSLKHIEEAVLDDVQQFFNTWYRPNNAILVIGGNIETEKGFELAEKWFGHAEQKEVPALQLIHEKEQTEAREKDVRADVPLDALMIAFPMQGRMEAGYHAVDTISDILSQGRSSRLYQSLVKDKKIFSEIEAYVTGSVDEGLFVVEGKLIRGVSIAEAEKLLWDELESFSASGVTEDELQKAKNKQESSMIFQRTQLLNRCMELAYAEMLGDADYANSEIDQYRALTTHEIQLHAKKLFRKEKSNTLRYLAEQTG